MIRYVQERCMLISTSAVQENITAVLTRTAADLLSHVAIRASSQGVQLATCFDEAALDSINPILGL